MDASIVGQIVIIIILIYMSSVFSSSETALMTVNKVHIRTLADRGDQRAALLLKVLIEPDKLLSAILISNNVVNLYASSLMTSLTIKIFGSAIVGISTGILTLTILVFGEVTPKIRSAALSERIALRNIYFINTLVIVLTPVVFILNKICGGVLAITGFKKEDIDESMTEEDLRTIVEVSHEKGVIENEEKQMINNVFDFGDTLVRDIMTPKVDMIFVQADARYEELIEIFRENKYTRMPIYDETPDKVIGIVNMKDVLLIDDKDFNLRKIMREPIFTFEQKKTSDLMVEMRESLANIVIVVDDYGVTSGMVTLEDMLEEIVGQIKDEYDADEEDEVEKISDKEYIIDGSMNIDDFNERFGTNIESEDYESIGGIIMGEMERVPKEGDKASLDGIELKVEKMDKTRVDRVRVLLF